jgi:hypothetical protein
MVDAQTLIDEFPLVAGADRDQAILNAVFSGETTVNWMPITSTIPGHTAVFQVCDDAIRIETTDGVRFRPEVSARISQLAADMLNASLMTAKIMDLAYQQANVVVDATILPASADMTTTAESKVWNSQVESKRAGRMGLFRDCGKAWILDNALAGSAGGVNYGFYSSQAIYTNPHVPSIKLWQNVGSRHNATYEDYSQTLQLMLNTCLVDGISMPVATVMADSVLSNLLNYGGILQFSRQPGT